MCILARIIPAKAMTSCWGAAGGHIRVLGKRRVSSEQPPKVTLSGFGVEYPILEPVHEDHQWTTNAIPHINDHVGAL